MVKMMSRKLDKAIAEALGWSVTCLGEDCMEWQDGRSVCSDLPHYSTDGNAMLELDKEMQERGWLIRSMMVFTNDIFVGYSFFEDGEMVKTVAGHAETEPLARALAAYKALTGKEWQERSAK